MISSNPNYVLKVPLPNTSYLGGGGFPTYESGGTHLVHNIASQDGPPSPGPINMGWLQK